MEKRLTKQGRVLNKNKNNDDNDNNNNNNNNNSSNINNTQNPKGSKRQRTLKEELYNLGDEFNEYTKLNYISMTGGYDVYANNESATNGGEAGERWLAGMKEVELPIEYKLKNIEQTERAKQLLLQAKPKHDRLLNIPRNFNQDYTSRHIDRIKFYDNQRRIAEKEQRIQMEKERQKKRQTAQQWYLDDSTVDASSLFENNNNTDHSKKS